MLASVYTDDEERGNAMGIALGGLAMGVLGKQNVIFMDTKCTFVGFGSCRRFHIIAPFCPIKFCRPVSRIE